MIKIKTRIDENGELTIPREVMNLLGLRSNKVTVEVVGDGLRIFGG